MTAGEGIPREAAQPATQVRICAKCRSHFPSDFEERLCPNCVAWAELYEIHADQRRAIGRR